MSETYKCSMCQQIKDVKEFTFTPDQYNLIYCNDCKQKYPCLRTGSHEIGCWQCAKDMLD